MSRFLTLIIHLHTLTWPVMMLLYPLYASIIAIERTSKVDDEQWLAYWILYSFLTLVEMLLQPIFEWIPIWYDMKLVFVAWLVLHQKFIREKLIKKYGVSQQQKSPHGKAN